MSMSVHYILFFSSTDINLLKEITESIEFGITELTFLDAVTPCLCVRIRIRMVYFHRKNVFTL